MHPLHTYASIQLKFDEVNMTMMAAKVINIFIFSSLKVIHRNMFDVCFFGSDDDDQRYCV